MSQPDATYLATMGSLERTLQHEPLAVQKALKAAAFAEVKLDGFRLGKYQVQIVEGPRLNTAGDVEVWLRVVGPQGEVPIDPHHVFRNPPIRHEGQEDLPGALQAMIARSVLAVLAP
jgi:hypothetical protein